MTNLKDLYVLEPPINDNNQKPNPCSDLTAFIDIDQNIYFKWEHSNLTNSLISFELVIEENIRSFITNEKQIIYFFSDRTTDSLPTTINITLYAISANGVKSDAYSLEITPTSIPSTIFSNQNNLKGISIISGDYTIQESDNLKTIICKSTTSGESYTITFPNTLSNGFQCYLLNSLESNTSTFTISGINSITQGFNNLLAIGNSYLISHISNGDFFTLNYPNFISSTTEITVTSPVSSGIIWLVNTAGITLTLPSDPSEGDFIGFKIGSNLDVGNNPIILNGNSKLVEGASNYLFTQPEEKNLFIFSNNTWISILKNQNRMGYKNISGNYTIQETDFKKLIKATGNITITLPASISSFFEVIVQNAGSGTITFSGLTNSLGSSNKLKQQWKTCHLYFDGTSWTGLGGLEI